MQIKKHLITSTACGLGALLLFASPAQADLETYEAPFFLNFGMDTGNDSGEGLLMTPSAAPFSLGWDVLQMTAGHASAMAVVASHAPGTRFTLRAEMRWEQFVPPKPDDRVGFAVLGGPHSPPDNAFDTTAGEFYSLTWSPAIDATTSVIEIREGFEGALLVQEVWQGRHPTTDNPWDGSWETYQLRAEGVYGGDGALELTFTLTDAAEHSQSVSVSIAEPRDGNLFGFGGSLSSDPAGEPQFSFLNFSMSSDVILQENFNMDERLVQNLPFTAAWYGTSSASQPVLSQPADGIITLDTSSNSQLITHFTDAGPVTLDVGETLKVTFGFRISGAAVNTLGIRAGVMDSTPGGRVTGDAHGTGHSRFANYTGYAAFFNPNGGGSTGIRLRKRNPPNSSLLSTASVWPELASGGGTIVINEDADYSGEFLITREAGGVTMTFSLFGENINEASVSRHDAGSDVFAFDTFGIWVNASAADSLSLTSAGIEVLPPEPPSVPLSVRIERTEGTDLRLTWDAIAGNVYRIQYKIDLTDPEWIDLEPDLVAEGSVLSTTIVADGSRRFLRVQLVTP